MNTNQFNQAMNTDIQAFIQNFAPAILGILIIFWVISRQLRARVVTARMTIYLILMAFGAIEIFQYVEKSGLTIGFLGNLLIYSLVLPPIFGWLRVLTYTYWVNDDQQVMRKGNLLTALFWIIYMALHLGLDHFTKAPGNLFLLFDIGFSLLVQRYLAYNKARKQFPKEIENNRKAKE